MTDDEYKTLKERLFNDAMDEVRKKIIDILMIIAEWILKALGAAWPLVLAWLRKNGYIDL